MEPENLAAQILTLAPIPTKITASLLSLAICDALGGPAEFRKRGTFPRITSMIYNRNFHVAPGTWTDDTSMTLCLARAIISSPGTPTDATQAELYIRWFRNGYLSATGECFDIGRTTCTALEIWESEKPAKKAAEKVKQQLSGEYQCGNGSLMRVLSVPLVYWRNPENAMKMARKSSDVTHPNEMCADACAAYTLLISTILTACNEGRRMSKKELLDVLWGYNFKSAALNNAVGRTSEFLLKPAAEIRTSGFVLHTLQAALWCFFRTESVEQGAICLVNMGDDADTVAAVYGGLAGAWYGDAWDTENSVHWTGRMREWREALVKREVVEEIAGELCAIQS